MSLYVVFCFFFNDTAPTEIYTLSLHDALPIYPRVLRVPGEDQRPALQFQLGPDRQHHRRPGEQALGLVEDRKSTRLNSSHANISYAVFCLKKKNITSYACKTKNKINNAWSYTQ